MRKTAPLAALFPTVRGEVLAATLTQPDKWWYLSELAQFIGTRPSSLQRELKALVDGGILERRREGTRIYFKADTRSPMFPELRGLLDKTAGLLPTIRVTLEPFQARIDCAFVYGSVARRQDHARSDVDLLVVLPHTGKAVEKSVEIRLATRPTFALDLLVRTPQQVRKRLAMGDTFMRDILQRGKMLYEADDA